MRRYFSRCHLHGFSLLVGSIMGHPWAAQQVIKAQRLVTFFQSSLSLKKLLKVAAVDASIRTVLPRRTETRFDSVIEMLECVSELKVAFFGVAHTNPKALLRPTARQLLIKDILRMGALLLIYNFRPNSSKLCVLSAAYILSTGSFGQILSSCSL